MQSHNRLIGLLSRLRTILHTLKDLEYQNFSNTQSRRALIVL